MFARMRVSIISAAFLGLAVSASVSANPVVIAVPDVVTGFGSTSVTVGDLQFVNYGLQGVGRISASQIDVFGDTFGSLSSMAITDWARSGNSYVGTINSLPDRGYNSPENNVFSNYAARIQQISFVFTPYTGAAPAPDQNQIAMEYKTGTQFRADVLPPSPGSATGSVPTTGLDPAPGAPGVGTLAAQSVPFVGNFSVTSGGVTTTSTVNRMAVDAEGLVLKSDGSGYVSDEYGPNIYYFKPGVQGTTPVKNIVAVLPLPEALQPRGGTGGVAANQLNYTSTGEPATGRRNNQGMEGISLSPDGTKLYALMQSATTQDSTTANQATRTNTRLLVYDVTTGAGGDPEHTLAAEYVIQLPIFRRDGTTGSPNRTAAQSEIISLGDGKLLVLSRDGNGLGSGSPAQAMFKSVLLVDTKGATNVLGKAGVDGPDGKVSPGGTLDPTITPLTWGQALNILNSEQLAKFGINLNYGAPDVNTLSEKWEALSLVSALDPDRPNDYFLFIGNDNDFLTQQGVMLGPDGLPFNYDAKTLFPDPALYANNDTWVFAYRVSLEPVPEPETLGLFALGLVALVALRRRAVAVG